MSFGRYALCGLPSFDTHTVRYGVAPAWTVMAASAGRVEPRPYDSSPGIHSRFSGASTNTRTTAHAPTIVGPLWRCPSFSNASGTETIVTRTVEVDGGVAGFGATVMVTND